MDSSKLEVGVDGEQVVTVGVNRAYSDVIGGLGATKGTSKGRL